MTNVLDALLDSWDRNSAITTNLLRLVPPNLMELSPADGSPSIVKLFTHMHYVRLVLVLEDTPEFARPMPKEEWAKDRDAGADAGGERDGGATEHFGVLPAPAEERKSEPRPLQRDVRGLAVNRECVDLGRPARIQIVVARHEQHVAAVPQVVRPHASPSIFSAMTSLTVVGAGRVLASTT